MRCTTFGRVPGWLVSMAALLALPSCAASARITGQLNACEHNPAKCEADCPAVRIQPGVDINCDALAVYRAERVVRGEGEQPPNALYIRGQITPWVRYVCEQEGVAQACRVRDGLLALEAKATARVAAEAASIDARKAAVEAKIAEWANVLSAMSSFPDYAVSGASRFQLQRSVDYARKTFLSGDLRAAEQAADELLKLARELQATGTAKVSALAQRQAQLQAQSGPIQAATSACELSPTACKAKCEAGDGAFCFAWATRVWKGPPPRPTDAKAAMQKSCDSGMLAACQVMPKIEADGVAVEDAWSQVERTGDSLTERRWIALYASSQLGHMPPPVRPQADREIKGTLAHVASDVQHLYCPARATFIAEAGAAEFAKRTADHCANHAPLGSSDGAMGFTVAGMVINAPAHPLTAECRVTFAGQCP